MSISKLALIAMLMSLAGCQSQPAKDGPVQPSSLTLSDMVKSDIDMVAEVSVRQSTAYLRELAEKLYRRNPNHLQLASGGELSTALDALFAKQRPRQLRGRRGADAIGLAFSDAYAGDRVAAFILGLRDMQREAYGGEHEFFLYHKYDPQKIYHLARNLEIASWRLRQNRSVSGSLFLLSVGKDQHGVTNTSFERLFGKLIGLHDHFAHVVADTSNRRIKNVVQGVASAVFFPI